MSAPTSGTPTLSQVKAWLGLDPDDTEDDAVLQASLDASLLAQQRVVTYPLNALSQAEWTADLIYAVYLRTQREASRRNSPEGIVGITGASGDFVGARVPPGDPDVIRLEGPYLKIVVA
jgi:hypothetical protein